MEQIEEIVEEIIPVENDSAEEAALKAYPRYWKHYPFDTNKEARAAFIKGYNQAKTDTALTLEDIDKIIQLWLSVWDEMDGTKQELYEEVARRFLETKNK